MYTPFFLTRTMRMFQETPTGFAEGITFRSFQSNF